MAVGVVRCQRCGTQWDQGTARPRKWCNACWLALRSERDKRRLEEVAWRARTGYVRERRRAAERPPAAASARPGPADR